MKRISVHRLYKERNNIPKEVLFWLYDNLQKPTEVALAIKIKDKFYNSDFIPENAKNWKQKLENMMKQIAIIQKTGWAKVAETEDQWGYPVTLMRCAYCGKEAHDPTTQCSCRTPIKFGHLNLDIAHLPMSESGIILQ